MRIERVNCLPSPYLIIDDNFFGRSLQNGHLFHVCLPFFQSFIPHIRESIVQVCVARFSLLVSSLTALSHSVIINLFWAGLT